MQIIQLLTSAMLCYTGRGCLTSKSNPQAGVLNNRLRYLDQTSALFSLAEQRAGNTTFAKTPLPLSRVRYQTTKPNRAYFYIHDRTRLRGSEYLVWLVITQWIGSPFVHKGVIWLCFFITYLSYPSGTDLSFVFFFKDIWREVVVFLLIFLYFIYCTGF